MDDVLELDPAGLRDFLAAVDTIYAAVLNPELWVAALAAIGAFAGAQKGGLTSQDLSQKLPEMEYRWGYDPELWALYIEKYAAENPLLDAAAFIPTGEVQSLSRSPFYSTIHLNAVFTDWAMPQGMVDLAQLTLDRTPTGVAAIVLVRTTEVGLVDAQFESRLRMLFPHLRRAILISRVLGVHRQQADELSGVIDRLATATFFITRDGMLTGANRVGREMLERGSPVRQDRLKLAFPAGAPQQALLRTLEKARSGNAQLGDAGVSVALRDGDDKRFVAHFLPMASHALLVDDPGTRPALAVFIKDGDVDQSAALATLAKSFRLTSMEGRVAGALVDTGSATMAADVLGLAPSTVRSHLKQIFAKAGVHSQLELAKLMISLAPPFADNSPN